MRRHTLIRWLVVTALSIVMLAPVGVRAAATIVIMNNDGANEGFNDPAVFTPVGGNNAVTLGAARLNAFTYAASLWGECINSGVTITIRAQMDPQTCTLTSAILGSAGATTVHRDFTNAPVANTWFSQALANSLNGADLDGGQPDVNATFNSNINGNVACLGGNSWYYGFDRNPGPGQIDFVTVVMHEICHGLGFQTFINDDTGALFMARQDQYSRFMEQAGATPSLYTAMNDAQRAAGNISDPNLRWTGGNANAQHPNIPITAGLNGGLLRLHGPNPTQPGSSLSHWSTALSPSELMEPSYTSPDHDMSLAIYLLQDIGWSVDTSDPVLTCPADLEDVECTTVSGTPRSNPAIQTWLNSVSVSGGCGEVVVVNDAPLNFPDGTTTVTFTATDGAISEVTCTADVTVVDTTPPDITCPLDITVECSDPCGVPASDPQLTAFFAGVSATDICDASPTITNDAPLCFGDGETTVTFTATDDDLNANTCTAVVKVEDTIPPEIIVELNRDVLWPPNHKLVEVCAELTVTDVCDPDPEVELVSIESDEPDNDKGDGNTANDIQDADYGTEDTCFDLRSERQGGGDGRKYTIIYSAEDDAGNVGYDTVCVRVPHDQGSGGMSSLGFNPSGTALTAGVNTFAVFIPGTSTLDVRTIDVHHVYVGNTLNVIKASDALSMDIDEDGIRDLAVMFESLSPDEITAAEVVVELPDETGLIDVSRTTDGPIGLHFVTQTGVDYLIPNIYALGAPVEMPTIIDLPRPDPTPGTILPNLQAEITRPTALTSVHPNPFNPETTVDFSLASGAFVRIAIYDVRGSLVRRLVDDTMPAGEHQARWNGRDDAGRPASSGIYFVRMMAGSYTEVRKVVMLK